MRVIRLLRESFHSSSCVVARKSLDTACKFRRRISMSTLRKPFDDATYTQYFGLLVEVAVDRFHVPDSDAESLAHEVLLGYVRKAETATDVRSYLIGAICHASRHYRRLNGRDGEDGADADLDRLDPSPQRGSSTDLAEVLREKSGPSAKVNRA